MNFSKVYKYKKSKKSNAYSIFARKRIKYIIPYIRDLKLKDVLELGCGEGSLSYEIKNYSKAEVYGLDASPSGVKLANKKGIKASVSDLNISIPFKTSTFDLVISDETIEHIYNTDIFIKEAFRVLKKNGKLIIITPNLSFWMNRILFLFGIYPLFLEVSIDKKSFGQGLLKKMIVEEDSMGHVRVFNLYALIDLLEENGFYIEKKVGIPLPWEGIPRPINYVFNITDILFSKKASFARDIMIVARK